MRSLSLIVRLTCLYGCGMKAPSKLGMYRSDHEDSNARSRNAIIDAGEMLFLERGIASTTMGDIAESAGVSRVTVYRYFPDRNTIASEVYRRMTAEITSTARQAVPPDVSGIEAVRYGFEAMVSEFPALKRAYRFCAMFYWPLRNEHDTEELVEWYNSREFNTVTLASNEFSGSKFDSETCTRLAALENTLFGALARLAAFSTLPGQDLASEGVAADAQLHYINEMALGFFDTAISPNAKVV